MKLLLLGAVASILFGVALKFFGEPGKLVYALACGVGVITSIALAVVTALQDRKNRK